MQTQCNAHTINMMMIWAGVVLNVHPFTVAYMRAATQHTSTDFNRPNLRSKTTTMLYN